MKKDGSKINGRIWRILAEALGLLVAILTGAISTFIGNVGSVWWLVSTAAAT